MLPLLKQMLPLLKQMLPTKTNIANVAHTKLKTALVHLQTTKSGQTNIYKGKYEWRVRQSSQPSQPSQPLGRQ